MNSNKLKATSQKGHVKELQKRAEEFFYNNILHELKEQFQQFVDDELFSHILDEKTKGHIDDLIRSIGRVKIDKLNAIKYFCDHEDLFTKINSVLADIPQRYKFTTMLASDDMNKRYLIPLILMPPSLEGNSQRKLQLDPVATSVIMEVLSRWLNFAREKEAGLNSLISSLSNIQENEFERYSTLVSTTREMEEHRDGYRELITLLEDTINKVIARPKKKTSQKRYAWEKVIIQGIETINDFCHTSECEKKDCRIIHNLAIIKTAELLTIIYPDEFPEGIEKTTEQIKTRYFDIRYARTETESFIRGLYSRYAEDPETTPQREGIVPLYNNGHVLDPLTGMHNRQFLLDAGSALHAAALRNKFNIAVFLIEISDLENLLNKFGNSVSDIIVKKQGDTITSLFKRQSDVVARMDGNHFCIVTPYDSTEKLCEFAERLRSLTENQTIESHGTTLSCSVTIGVCLQQLGTLEKMVKHADSMVTKARQKGNSSVCVS